MCMSCGCGKPNETHGNPDHITLDQMRRAAQAADIDVEQAADNIHAAARQVRAADQARQPARGAAPGVASASGSAPHPAPVTGATPSTYNGDLPGADGLAGQAADDDLGRVTT